MKRKMCKENMRNRKTELIDAECLTHPDCRRFSREQVTQSLTFVLSVILLE